MKIFLKLFTIVTLFSTMGLQAQKQTESNASQELRFFSKNGELDLSNYLSQAYGFLPVPILITEPAIGYGAGVSLVYLHDKFVGRKGVSGRNIPPSMSGIILAKTENGTKIGGGFHLGYYLEDRLRTQTFAMMTDINMHFYTAKNRPVFLNLKNPIFYQSFKYRIAESDMFLGAGYLYTSSEIKLNTVSDHEITLPTHKITSSALGLIFDYDTRDNALSPNKGMLFNARANFFSETLGSDNDFQKYFFQELLYMPLTEKINLDHHISYDTTVGKDAPFYMYPAINMRGVPAMQYQGENVALYEAQLTYDVTPRWSAVAFAGVARAYGKRKSILGEENNSFKDASTVVAKGIGFRYLIAEKFGLRMGVDIAMSNDDKAFYIQFGTAWLGL